MKLLSHRGYWTAPREKNTLTAFSRSFQRGLGTELDIRDCAGELVVSHDMPNPESGLLRFDDFLSLYAREGRGLTLALNIKADGLHAALKGILSRHGVQNYFLFDMSVPDALGYLSEGMTVFTRLSDYEPAPLFIDQATGVWVDCFKNEWKDSGAIEKILKSGKSVVMVSPDLHKRSPAEFWERMKSWDFCCSNERFYVCTDLIEEGTDFFKKYLEMDHVKGGAR